MSDPRQHVHELIDQLPPAKLNAVAGLLEALIHNDAEELTDEDRRAIAASLDYFENGGEGISFEQVVADLGFTLDQVRGHKGD
jgi:hypothetical protein